MALAPPRRRELVATCLSNSIEWYDFAVYGAMASVLVVVLLPPGAGASGLVGVFAVFATAFLARPVGALVMGVRADRLGRRGALAAMVVLMAAATAAIGLLPPWSVAGAAVPVALVLLRLVQGFSSGGQIGTSITFLLESGSASRWGRYSGWHTATIALGIAGGLAVAGLVSAVLSQGDLEAWGWRLPFLAALPLGTVGLYVRLRLEESPAFDAAVAVREAPTPRRVVREHGRAVRTGFLMVGVLTGTFNLWFVFLPAHLETEDTHRLSVALACAAAGLLATAVAAPLLGGLSDRIGRQPVILAGSVSLSLLALPMFYLATRGSTVLLLVADVVIGVVLGALVISAHLAERFPVAVRATGLALTAGLGSALIGGTAPLVGSVLAAIGPPVGIPLLVSALSAIGVVATIRALPITPV